MYKIVYITETDFEYYIIIASIQNTSTALFHKPQQYSLHLYV